MSVYLYTTADPAHAATIAADINAEVVRHFDGLNFWRRGKKFRLTPDDALINIGPKVSEFLAKTVVNIGCQGPPTKVRRLNAATIHVSTPTLYTKIDAIYSHMWDSPNWKQRCLKANAKSGMDLLYPELFEPDFATCFYRSAREFRLYTLNKSVIIALEKIPKEGMEIADSHEAWRANPTCFAHPWVRTKAGNWTTKRVPMTKSTGFPRQVVHAAKTFPYNAIVDIGLAGETTPIVYNVKEANFLDPDIYAIYRTKLRGLITAATRPATPLVEVDEIGEPT